MNRSRSDQLPLLPFVPWLLLLAMLLTLAGYFGPWVPHRVSGLVVTGLDLGEYVKFLPLVRGGQITLWRESFYLPLVVVSLAASFAAFQPHLQVSWLLRVPFLALAMIAALNLLPPAWDQSTFTNPEFRQQIMALAFCLLVMATSPLWALLPRVVSAGAVTVLSLAAIWFPLRDFYQVLPSIHELYQHAFPVGRGVYLTVAGLLLLLGIHGVELLVHPQKCHYNQ